jgi:hypothetical protein
MSNEERAQIVRERW